MPELYAAVNATNISIAIVGPRDVKRRCASGAQFFVAMPKLQFSFAGCERRFVLCARCLRHFGRTQLHTRRIEARACRAPVEASILRTRSSTRRLSTSSPSRLAASLWSQARARSFATILKLNAR